MPYKDTLHFDSLVIIDSLAASEIQTGEWLFDAHLQPLAKKHGPFAVERFHAANVQEFYARLDFVHRKYILNGHCPILHIEAHGDDDGLQLASGDCLAWEDLRWPLTAMNVAVGLNLLVVCALCSGRHLSTILNPTKPAPAWGVIGPTGTVKPLALREAMAAFYGELFEKLDVRKAMDLMNGFVQYGEWTYKLDTAEVMLFRVYKHVLLKLKNPELAQDQENEIVAEVVRRHNYDLLVSMHARHQAREMLGDHRKYYEFFRHTFLMIDSHPANDARFKLTFDECAAMAESAA